MSEELLKAQISRPLRSNDDELMLFEMEDDRKKHPLLFLKRKDAERVF